MTVLVMIADVHMESPSSLERIISKNIYPLGSDPCNIKYSVAPLCLPQYLTKYTIFTNLN